MTKRLRLVERAHQHVGGGAADDDARGAPLVAREVAQDARPLRQWQHDFNAASARERAQPGVSIESFPRDVNALAAVTRPRRETPRPRARDDHVMPVAPKRSHYRERLIGVAV